MGRLIALVLAAVATSVVLAPTGAAQQGGLGGDDGALESDAWGSDGEYGTSVLRYGVERGSIGSSDDPCQWLLQDYRSYQGWWRALPGAPFGDDDLILEDDEGAEDLYARPWVTIWCTGPSGFTEYLDGFQQGDPPGDPRVVLEHARRTLFVPLPVASFSPDPDAGAPQVVGLQTWLWIDPAGATDLSATACIPDAGGVPPFACATVRAEFLDAGFAMGDATPDVVCDGPGLAYDPDRPYADQAGSDHCFHVYAEAEPGGTQYPVVATSFWRVSWSCRYDGDADGSLDSGCGGGPLETVGRTQAPVLLEVLDLQARAVPTDG